MNTFSVSTFFAISILFACSTTQQEKTFSEVYPAADEPFEINVGPGGHDDLKHRWILNGNRPDLEGSHIRFGVRNCEMRSREEKTVLECPQIIDVNHESPIKSNVFIFGNINTLKSVSKASAYGATVSGYVLEIEPHEDDRGNIESFTTVISISKQRDKDEIRNEFIELKSGNN
ncbi:MAG: hypothetical protein EOP04_21255 [Proteobacteria bacterium]|nr:MAG: hypothetical protein EOP04_21255 [Pseudomonadota bacterium]